MGVGVQNPSEEFKVILEPLPGIILLPASRESLTGAMAQSASSTGRWGTAGRPGGEDRECAGL